MPKAKPGYNDALSTSLTFVFGPVIFGALGALLDRALGTGPILMIAFGVLGLVAVATTIYYRYQAASAAEDAGKPWTRRAA
ncbi:MAG: AtpZ/AtpI family protein [Actinomycetes bacterium]